MASIKDVVFDCAYPASLARFWAAVLDGYQIAPYDEAELKRLRAEGINDPEDDPTVLVEAGSGVTPRIWFQQVPEPKITKNRVHLDIRLDSTEQLGRLVDLGATVVEEHPGWTVMADPKGNEFCVFGSDAQRACP